MKAVASAVLAVAFAATDLAASGAVYNVGGEVKAPVLISRPEIDYAPCKIERKTRWGIPIAEAVIDASGKVQKAKLIKGVDPCIDRQFLNNLRSWKFRPGTRKGKRVAVRMNFTLHIHYD